VTAYSNKGLRSIGAIVQVCDWKSHVVGTANMAGMALNKSFVFFFSLHQDLHFTHIDTRHRQSQTVTCFSHPPLVSLILYFSISSSSSLSLSLSVFISSLPCLSSLLLSLSFSLSCSLSRSRQVVTGCFVMSSAAVGASVTAPVEITKDSGGNSGLPCPSSVWESFGVHQL